MDDWASMAKLDIIPQAENTKHNYKYNEETRKTRTTNHNNLGGGNQDFQKQSDDSNESETCEKINTLQMDTCMQPIDIAAEALARHDDFCLQLSPRRK